MLPFCNEKNLRRPPRFASIIRGATMRNLSANENNRNISLRIFNPKTIAWLAGNRIVRKIICGATWKSCCHDYAI